MTSEIHNGMDLIDSRDIIARIDELENDIVSFREDFDRAKEEGDEEAIEFAQRECDDFAEEYGEELEALKNLQEQCDRVSDWIYGETLIRYDYFEEYAQDLAEDIGVIDRNAVWPLDCIDWGKAADELKFDYTSVDFDGVEYWIRS